RFEFPYMAQLRHGGAKRPPPKAESLQDDFLEAIKTVLAQSTATVLIGGKSMGGRIATMLGGRNDLDARIAGIVCLGYPLHPQKKPEQLRLAPLLENRLPLLVVQGERDPFGTKIEFDALSLPRPIKTVWAENGNHDLAPTGRAPATWEGNLALAAEATVDFARLLSR
ncbi:MAG: hypothetical protein MI923_03310, partial [Phycisphaerales bacterium]|nr:hypothetical protein [Phycisphaerales bacterium]